MDVTALVNQFKNLDLAKYPKQEILSLFNQVGSVGYVAVILHKGKIVMRARPNYNDERFEKRSDYSFKPQQFNNTYQRASTPFQTMFYATMVPENVQPGELDNLRVIGVAETIPMMRNQIESGYQRISFGKWVVNEPIEMIAIVQKDRYADVSSYTRELSSAYQEFLDSYAQSPDVVDRSLKYSTFLADEFSKGEIKGDFDYMISAIFTELITKKGFAGVLYPSVRTGGKGFNIAITPQATQNLSLVVAGECTVYKRKNHTVIGNEAVVQLRGYEQEFRLTDLNPDRDLYLKKLGVTSIDELIR